MGVAVIGAVPAGLPSFSWSPVPRPLWEPLLTGAGALALVSITSGMVTARSFAARNGYEVDVDRECIAMAPATSPQVCRRGSRSPAPTRDRGERQHGWQDPGHRARGSGRDRARAVVLHGPATVPARQRARRRADLRRTGTLRLAGPGPLRPDKRGRAGGLLTAMFGVVALGAFQGIGLAVPGDAGAPDSVGAARRCGPRTRRGPAGILRFAAPEDAAAVPGLLCIASRRRSSSTTPPISVAACSRP